MRTYLLKITSPDGDIFCGDVVSLRVRGTEGELAVMSGHIPFVSYIVPCECKIELEDGSTKIGQIESGVLTVSDEKTILLSGAFIWQ